MRFSSTIIFGTFLVASFALAASVRDPAFYRRQESVLEYSSLTRRAHSPVCASHNENIMCESTHECLTSSGRPTRKHGAHATLNAFCETSCSCRQPLGEISGNEQRKKPQGRTRRH